MQLLVVRLADTIGTGPAGGSSQLVQNYRHWLTYPDGRIFYQDETIYIEWEKELISARTDWMQLPTPPMVHTAVGFAKFETAVGGEVNIALRSDGRAFAWNATDEEWQVALRPVPGTPAALEDEVASY